MSLPSGSAAMFSASARGVRVANGVAEIFGIVGGLQDELQQSKELNKRLRDHIDELQRDAKRLAADHRTLVGDKTDLTARVENLEGANDKLVRANEGLVIVNKDLVATNELLHGEIQRLRKKEERGDVYCRLLEEEIDVLASE